MARHGFAMRLVFLIMIAGLYWTGAAHADEIAWPLEPCTPAEIASASPAPVLNDSRSLASVPFYLTLQTLTAGYIVSLDEHNAPIIRCATYDSSPYLLYRGTVAVAGLAFATPRLPNNAIQGGRYLVRLFDLLGIGTIRPPPAEPILPACSPTTHWPHPGDTLKVAHRVQPDYPDGALEEGIEGQVDVVLEIFANGAVAAQCLGSSWPVGWFEQSALSAVRQWRFDPQSGPGPRYYTVSVKFKIEG